MGSGVGQWALSVCVGHSKGPCLSIYGTFTCLEGSRGTWKTELPVQLPFSLLLPEIPPYGTSWTQTFGDAGPFEIC